MRYLNVTGLNNKIKRNKEYDMVTLPSAVVFYLSVLEDIKKAGEDRYGFAAASICTMASFKEMNGIVLPNNLQKPFRKEDFISCCASLNLDIDFVD